ncbi:MAG: alpha/beta fold hydrolase [Candidatus Saccharimonadaceae bacterium]
MSIRLRLSNSFHRYLNVPYSLHVHEFRKPKRPKATYVLIHGIGNTLHSWDEVVKLMPKDVRIIGIDLLGFGKSPKPAWAIYNAKTQARSVGVTLFGLRMAQRPIIVGHSLGALVAVEIARRYPLLPKQLVLCSPPFYSPQIDEKKIGSPDDMLRMIYEIARKHPEQLAKFTSTAVKLGLANKTLNLSGDTRVSYFAALESSIINQTSLQDVAKLRLPIHILYGAFDAVVIKKHITTLAKTHTNITTKRLNAGHEVVGGYVKVVSGYLKNSA